MYHSLNFHFKKLLKKHIREYERYFFITWKKNPTNNIYFKKYCFVNKIQFTSFLINYIKSTHALRITKTEETSKRS